MIFNLVNDITSEKPERRSLRRRIGKAPEDHGQCIAADISEKGVLFLFVDTVNKVRPCLRLLVYQAFYILRIMLEVIIYSDDKISFTMVEST